ncbi:RNA polymerase sigma factor [Niabella ginsengisoli]|uniref:Sigma-70 family RNA polymerase sigma factor n=1 Tax=Niabella ginsengisoli TaxID=522298 RepID=A0ABS9SII3_9BACT|nr:sigma-70 family RNA polymerase sigma factor [Niabella ginsengisoli]MCH5598154.1 sigma-70 family RNA polymerase sigma factor [Niabella ginsengisoli]
MQQQELIPHLFRTEYRKIVAVLCSLFGLQHIETAEDLVSDTFLSAAELWGQKGVPENPAAWLYTVAKNKTKNHLRRVANFDKKISKELSNEGVAEIELDLSEENINDSQLAMMFAVCDPSVAKEAQVALALNLLCGFDAQEIADAFLTNKDVVYKRIQRAKEKLRSENISLAYPTVNEISTRMDSVLSTIYLLFNEGYYSSSQNSVLRKDLCWEAMRLCYLLVSNDIANTTSANALLSLMCFHASRFEARLNEHGELILYKDQDTSLWNEELIVKGRYYLKIAFADGDLSKYHFEAAIASWHTIKEDSPEKWATVLQLYDQLLQLEYSPMAAFNRIYVLSKVRGKQQAIEEAEQLNIVKNHFYYTLLGKLHEGIDDTLALSYFKTALTLAITDPEKKLIMAHMHELAE